MYLKGFIAPQETLPPARWVFKFRKLDRNGPWIRAHTGFHIRIDAAFVDSVYRFRSDPARPQTELID